MARKIRIGDIYERHENTVRVIKLNFPGRIDIMFVGREDYLKNYVANFITSHDDTMVPSWGFKSSGATTKKQAVHLMLLGDT